MLYKTKSVANKLLKQKRVSLFALVLGLQRLQDVNLRINWIGSGLGHTNSHNISLLRYKRTSTAKYLLLLCLSLLSLSPSHTFWQWQQIFSLKYGRSNIYKGSVSQQTGTLIQDYVGHLIEEHSILQLKHEQRALPAGYLASVSFSN